jgi:hypothetical protein
MDSYQKHIIGSMVARVGITAALIAAIVLIFTAIL